MHSEETVVLFLLAREDGMGLSAASAFARMSRKGHSPVNVRAEGPSTCSRTSSVAAEAGMMWRTEGLHRGVGLLNRVTSVATA